MSLFNYVKDIEYKHDGVLYILKDFYVSDKLIYLYNYNIDNYKFEIYKNVNRDCFEIFINNYCLTNIKKDLYNCDNTITIIKHDFSFLF